MPRAASVVMIPGDIIASHIFHKWRGYNLINPDNVKWKCINAKIFPTLFLYRLSIEEIEISHIKVVEAMKKIKAKNQENPPKPF